jgi:hypothetical protein
MNRNRLANGSEIEAAEVRQATRPPHWPRAPTHESRRNAPRCSALRLLLKSRIQHDAALQHQILLAGRTWWQQSQVIRRGITEA